MRIVVPFGFYGWGNIGDEATLNGFAQLLRQGGIKAQVTAGSRNPAHTARAEPSFRYFNPTRHDPRRWWAKYRATTHVFAGGTPIGDNLGDWPLSEVAPLVRSIDRWKVPLTFVGVGIENLKQEKSRRIFAGDIVPRVRHWSVRCDRDCQRLIEYGVKPEAVTVAADMAWLIEPASADFGKKRLQTWQIEPGQPLIGVNLANENRIFDQHPAMVDALAQALDRLIDELGARVVFLANETRDEPTFDRAPAIMVVGRMKRAARAFIAPNEYLAPRQMMSIIGQCRLTMSMRYHFCLFSALQHVPFIGIARSEKISDICWDLGWKAMITPPSFGATEVFEHSTRLMRDAADLTGDLQQRIIAMKDRALLNLNAIHALRTL